MHRSLLTLIAAALLLSSSALAQSDPAVERFVGAGLAEPEPEPEESLLSPFGLSGSASLDLASIYFFRGADLLDDRPAFQPSVTIEAGESGFAVLLWASLATSGRDDAVARTRLKDELDVDVSWSRDVGNFSFTIGHVSYIYPYVDASNTAEWYAMVGFEFPTIVEGIDAEMSFSAFYDYNLGEGLYLKLAGQKSWEVPLEMEPELDLVWGGWIGYNYGQYGLPHAFTDVTLHFGLELEHGNWTFGLTGHYSMIPNRAYNPDPNEAWALFSVDLAF